jgi:hypothetical protein
MAQKQAQTRGMSNVAISQLEEIHLKNIVSVR